MLRQRHLNQKLCIKFFGEHKEIFFKLTSVLAFSLWMPIDDAAVAGAEIEKGLEEEKDCLAKALAHPMYKQKKREFES